MDAAGGQAFIVVRAGLLIAVGPRGVYLPGMRWSAVLLVAAACGSSTRSPGPPSGPPAPVAPATTFVAPAGALVDPGVRLPRDLAIARYELTLKLDPGRPTMTGTIAIHGELKSTTGVLWLHGEDLVIGRARATRRGVDDVPLEVVPNTERGKLALRSPVPMVAGPLVVTIDFTATLAETETAGTFRQKVGEDWYAFTQHEAISARRSFPCLDEPDLKVPWKVTLHVPTALTAVANAPVVSDVALDAQTRAVEFAPTDAIPSYLIAYAVGPFEIVDAGKSASGTPHRIITLRGRASEAAYAAEIMPKITTELEKWFGMPHPFPKLDSISIPATVGFGAMENPGLVTYRETLLLLPPDAGAIRKARLMAIGTHEVAHQWFGNLVTPVWWDDIWLNESFASWLPEKVIAALEPTWRHPTDSLDQREEALAIDVLASVRKIRQPIAGEGDIVTAFDRITYAKGAAVLRLWESRLGTARFQAGVRAYLTKHARGNATAADFLIALDAAAPDAGAGAGMATLLDQAGAPRLTATLECPKDGQAGVRLAQERLMAPGAGQVAATRWQLPVCVRAGGNGASEEVCATITETTSFMPLSRCATWVWPNAGGLGYWRTTMTRAGWDSLRRSGWKQLTATERVAVAGDLFAAATAGEVELASALDLVPLLIAEDNRAAMVAVTRFIRDLAPLVPPAQRKRYAAWVRAQLGRRALALGWLPGPRDQLYQEAVRDQVVSLVATVGEEPGLARAAAKLARDWRKLPDAARGPVLMAAVRARPELADELTADFRAETSRALRGDLADGIASVREPERLQRALALALDPAIDVRDALDVLFTAAYTEETREVAVAFTLANLDALIARLEGETAGSLIGVLIGGCDVAAVEGRRALVEEKLGKILGARRRIDQAFERVATCAARRAAVAPALTRWLSKR